MTDEELIDALRKNALWVTTHDAADRIEALVKERDYAQSLMRNWQVEAGAEKARAERLEAALRELKHRWYLGDLQEKDFTAALEPVAAPVADWRSTTTKTEDGYNG